MLGLFLRLDRSKKLSKWVLVDIYMRSMQIEIPKACQVLIFLSLDFSKFLIIQIIFICLLIVISE